MKCDDCLNKETPKCDDCYHNPIWGDMRSRRRLEDFYEPSELMWRFHQRDMERKKVKEYLDRQ